MAAKKLHVFLNMPFDSKGIYRDLLIAYVAALSGLGFTARTVLELEQTTDRLTRLKTLIKGCASSIHDLSCAEPKREPRFNMPFELGLAVMASDTHRWFVFESVNYRLQRTLSDLNGYDPLIHAGNTKTAIARLRDVFRHAKRQTTLTELLAVQKEAIPLAKRIEADQGSLIGRQAFGEFVLGCRQIARTHRLI